MGSDWVLFVRPSNGATGQQQGGAGEGSERFAVHGFPWADWFGGEAAWEFSGGLKPGQYFVVS